MNPLTYFKPLKLRWEWAAALGGLVFCAAVFAAAPSRQISLSIGDITTPLLRAKGVEASLEGRDLSVLQIRVKEISIAGQSWRDVRLTCARLELDRDSIDCRDGVIKGQTPLPLAFAYSGRDGRLEVSLRPSPNETWQFIGCLGRVDWQAAVAIINGRAERLAPWLPDSLPKPNKGEINASALVRGAGDGPVEINASLDVKNLAFGDASGLHAGENVSAGLNLSASGQRDRWQWRGSADWGRGDVFWQPLYFSGGGHGFRGEGALDSATLTIARGSVTLSGVGSADISGSIDRSSHELNEFNLSAANLDLNAVANQVLKPFFAGTVLAELKASGRGDVQWRYGKDGVQAFQLNLRDASIEDERRRFAFFGVNAAVPWLANGPARAEIRFARGEVLQIPLGAVHVPVEMHGMNFVVPRLGIPVLDGKLTLDDFAASNGDDGWQWQFSGGLTPISMERLTDALKLPVMHGKLSGVIPRVSYGKSTLKVGGALLFKVFDGTVVAKNLVLLDPLGIAPRMSVDLDMRNLDLDLLTRTFSFGNIQGRVDVQVAGLELANWEPVTFDASVMSSPGDYPRKISQRAVENISALGGAGAAAAIQRSFLRFFEQFGYSKIGLRCALRNGVCRMDGIESAPQGYVIVKGGGIPAITVMGYNRTVSWHELLDRLKRITQNNVQPIVQ